MLTNSPWNDRQTAWSLLIGPVGHPKLGEQSRPELISNYWNRSAKENKTRGSADEGRTEPAIEIDLETPDQSVDEMEKKTTESTPMPNAQEQKQKSVEFSPIDNVEDTTGNTRETVKDESQTKRTSFTES